MSIRQVLRKGARLYDVDGIGLFPSVTTVLKVVGKPGLIEWQKGLALNHVKQALAERAQRGSLEELGDDAEVRRLMHTARNKPAQDMRIAATFGTTAHKYMEDIVHDDLAGDVPPMYRQVVANFRAFCASVPDLQFHVTEKVVYSRRWEYAGSVDAVASLPLDSQHWQRLHKASLLHSQDEARDLGRPVPFGGGAALHEAVAEAPCEPSLCPPGHGLVLVDWKTSNATYADYGLQLAAYAGALECMTGDVVGEAWIVRLEKHKPGWEVRRVAQLSRTFGTFLAALRLWKDLEMSNNEMYL